MERLSFDSPGQTTVNYHAELQYDFLPFKEESMQLIFSIKKNFDCSIVETTSLWQNDNALLPILSRQIVLTPCESLF